MKSVSQSNVKSDFALGFEHGVPIMLGYFAVCIAYGITVCKSGLPFWLATIVSFTNLTSAGQFAGTNLMVAGASLIEIFVTLLVINSRYFLMSLSLTQKIDKNMNTFCRASMAYGITDEIFAVAIGKGGIVTGKYMKGLILGPVIGWVGGATVGGLFANILPANIVNAMGVALYAMFIAIVIPPSRDSKPVLFTVLLSAAISIGFAYLPIVKELSSGWSIIIITILVSAIAATFFPINEENEAANSATEKSANADQVSNKTPAKEEQP